MDRLIREGNPPVGQLASPVPQYKRLGSTDYEPVEGQHGAPFAILKDASGNVVSPATDAKLEQVKSELALVKSELAAIKANQLSGDQKVQLKGTIESFFPTQPNVVSALMSPLAAGETREIADVKKACVIEAISITTAKDDNKIRFTLSRYQDDLATTVAYWQIALNYASFISTGLTMEGLKVAGGLFGFKVSPNLWDEADVAQTVQPLYCPYGFKMTAQNTSGDSAEWGRVIVAYREVK